MILPFFGVSDADISSSRKPLFGYKAVAYSESGDQLLGLIVWAHHMFTSGTPGWLQIFFMVTTMIISMPTGIKIFQLALATHFGEANFD